MLKISYFVCILRIFANFTWTVNRLCKINLHEQNDYLCNLFRPEVLKVVLYLQVIRGRGHIVWQCPDTGEVSWRDRVGVWKHGVSCIFSAWATLQVSETFSFISCFQSYIQVRFKHKGLGQQLSVELLNRSLETLRVMCFLCLGDFTGIRSFQFYILFSILYPGTVQA